MNGKRNWADCQRKGLISRNNGPRMRRITDAEIRVRETCGDNVVFDPRGKNELQLRVRTGAARKCFGLLTGNLSSGKKGRTALMLSLRIPHLLGTTALAKL